MVRFLGLFVLLFPMASLLGGDSTWVRTVVDGGAYHAPTLANGMIGITPAKMPLKSRVTLLQGVYDDKGANGMSKSLIEGLHFLDLDLILPDGRHLLEADDIEMTDWEQTLHLDRATLSTRFTFADQLVVSCEQSVLRHLPYGALLEVTIEALNDAEIGIACRPSAGPDVTVSTPKMEYIGSGDSRVRLVSLSGTSPTGRHEVSSATAFLVDSKKVPKIDWIEPGAAGFFVPLAAGERFQLALVGTMLSTAQVEDPRNAAIRLAIYAAKQGLASLKDGHERAWNELWEGGDIVIEGDANAQWDVRFALYNLYSYVRAGSRLSIPPMGLSSTDYAGHYFWDSEMWMFPPLLLLHPELARGLLDYRFDRLEAARRNAWNHGYRGAMFPWESSDTGDEATPVWALTGTFEHHITADVGNAFWWYYCVTRDEAWLREIGFPVMQETAEFWLSRITVNEKGECEIRNVVCADEYAENVDNNAFTNGAVIYLLRAVHEAALVLGNEPDPAWLKTAQNIPLRRFSDGTIREHETYDGEIIKQADVNLLTYPLGLIEDPQTMSQDLRYYSSRCDAGPAMTHCIYSVVANRLEDREAAYAYFLKGYQPNQRVPYGILAETPNSQNPYFATGAGGMLQAILAGFAGLEITAEGVQQVASVLPSHWKSVTIRGVSGLGDVTIHQ